MSKFLVLALLLGATTLSFVIAQSEEGEQSQPEPLRVEQRKNVVQFDGGVEVFLDGDQRVEVSAIVLGGQSRLLEFLVVAAAGAAHEALFQIAARPYDVHQALEILGLKSGEKKLAFRGDAQQPDGADISIHVRWNDDEGKSHTAPVEDWIYDTLDDAPMKQGPWSFSGSIAEHREDLGRDIYLADQVSALIALWRDPSCVIDNPRPHGAVPDVYLPRSGTSTIPAPRTPVTLILRAYQAPEPEKHDAE